MNKFRPEEKIDAVLRHIERGDSCEKIALSMGTGEATIATWCRLYDSEGVNAFEQRNNSHYSKEFKVKVVEYYLAGKGSLNDACKIFGIRSHNSLRKWIMLYNSHELKATPVGGRGIMTKGRKTTFDERVQIVTDCIDANMNYSLIAEKHQVSYQQIYKWVRKYKENGVDGLVDRRGRTKPIDEMSELEKIKAENKILKAQLERKELENKLLKKVEEIERRRF